MRRLADPNRESTRHYSWIMLSDVALISSNPHEHHSTNHGALLFVFLFCCPPKHNISNSIISILFDGALWSRIQLSHNGDITCVSLNKRAVHFNRKNVYTQQVVVVGLAAPEEKTYFPFALFVLTDTKKKVFRRRIRSKKTFVIKTYSKNKSRYIVK